MKGKSLVDWCVEKSRQDILLEWDNQSNYGVDINCVSYGSTKKYWWKCAEGHSWEATPNNRTSKSRGGCPVCVGKLIVSGINDLQTAIPQIADKWNYKKNFPMTPDLIAPKSNKKFWWICKYGHEFESAVYQFVINIDQCPYCSNKKVLSGFNDLVTTNPELMTEWDYDRNTIDPKKVSYGSNKKVWWRCSNGHNFLAAISSRAGKQKTGCPYCAHQKTIVGENDLATTNPELLNEWDYKKNSINPTEVFLKSNIKIWWTCDKGHSYQALLSDRAVGEKCPICAGRKVLVGYNDLETLNPKLAKEWHPILNGILSAQDFTTGSNKSVWWMCAKGHEWKAAISSRTAGRNCPQCNSEKQISLPEKAIFFYVKKYFSDAVSNVNFEWLGKMELDIFIPSLSVGIEYDGARWHRNVDKDILKDKKCHEKGITLIRIRESDCMDYESDSIKIKVDKSKTNISFLELFLNEISDVLKGYIPSFEKVQIDIKNDYGVIVESVYMVDKCNSLAFCNKELALQWDFEKNGSLTPEMIPSGSQKKVWWRCSNNHSWNAQVLARTRGTGCPYCSGKMVIDGDNDLATKCPQIIEEWDFEKNSPVTPNQISWKSNKKIWWKCSEGHSWQATVSSRTRIEHPRCPYCINQKVLVGFNDLATTNPELLAEWDYQKNENILPQEVTAGSEKKVWWICPAGHSYFARISPRAKKNVGCQECYNLRRKNK